MPIIESNGLGRTFRTRRAVVEAVKGVDFEVDDGEIVGFLGPNGAGKTTTFRMLTTLLRPTTGSARVAGADLLRDPEGVREAIGYVPQSSGSAGGGSDPNSTVWEELVIQGQFYRQSARQAADRARQLAGQLDLTGLEHKLTKTLSGGQHRRLDIALGLVHSPRVAFLDEPSTGLDPQSRSNLWEHIKRLRNELGMTIFLSTHYLEEADVLCDRILVIDQGRIVAEGTSRELKQRVCADVIELGVTSPAAAREVIETETDIRQISADGATLRLAVREGPAMLPALVRLLDAAGLTLTSVQLVTPTLDDVFLTLTGRDLRDGSPAAVGQSETITTAEAITTAERAEAGP
jgi:ABC-2 type transport system ATP-binding protein